jgi:hypothetical protein
MVPRDLEQELADALRMDVGLIGESDDFLRHGIERSWNIEAFTSRGRRNEESHETPDHPGKGSMHEMSCIHENHDPFSFPGLSQSRLQVFFSKALLLILFVRIRGPSRDRGQFASPHSDALHKGFDLSGRSPDSSQLLDGGLCLCRRSRRILFEVGFERGLMFEKCAGLPPVVQLLEPYHTAISVLLQISCQRRFRDPANPTDFLVGHLSAFQIEDFHLSLNYRARMMISLIVQILDDLKAEFDSDHGVLLPCWFTPAGRYTPFLKKSSIYPFTV